MSDDDEYDRKAAVAALIELEQKAISAAVHEAEVSMDEPVCNADAWAPVVGAYREDATEEDFTEVAAAVEEGRYIGPDEPSPPVLTVSHEVGEVLQALSKRITDLEAMLEAQRTLTAKAETVLEFQQVGERTRRIEAEQNNRQRLWAIDALVEALAPFARFVEEENGQVRGMTEPVCLSMAAVHRADALVKLHRALR